MDQQHPQSQPQPTASADSSRPATPAAQETTQDTLPNAAQQPVASFSESWNYWKKRHGSAEGQNRKMSSIDPLASETEPVSPLNGTNTEPVLLQPNNANGTVPPTSSQSWTNYLNPLTYVPEAMFNLQLPLTLDSPSTANDSQSDHSSTQTPQTDGGWFSWMWGGKRHIEEDEHGILSSAETKKLVKDCKRLVQSADTVWAWYNEPLVPGKESEGEISVLKTRSETKPVRIKRYPHKAGNPAPIGDHDTLSEVVPRVQECYREITTRTKVRLASQLYYNLTKEKHIYIKRNMDSRGIKNIVIISIVGQTKIKHNVNSKQLTDYTTDAVKDWFHRHNPYERFHLHTLSLEAAKIDSASLEHIIVLLMNWRETLKLADYVEIVGLKNSAPLATLLLDALISRKLVTETRKFGLHFVDASIPGPYLEASEASNVSYATPERFENALSSLVHHHNVKVSILGSLSNIPSTLALHLNHANIFRTIYIPDTSYNNDFEVHLFKLLLMAHNLGHPVSRLILQVSKYFTASTSISDCLCSEMFNAALENSLSTTRLLKPCPLLTEIIQDPILNNNYNLIWTLHAFVDDFKKIKNIESLKKIKAFLTSYKGWDPQSKSLKDLKYMLEVLGVEEYSGAILRE